MKSPISNVEIQNAFRLALMGMLRQRLIDWQQVGMPPQTALSILTTSALACGIGLFRSAALELGAPIESCDPILRDALEKELAKETVHIVFNDDGSVSGVSVQ